MADILAFNPQNGKSVGIQVKTGWQNGKTDIKKVPLPLITTVPDRIDTLKFLAPYVFVYVPDDPKDKPRFFIVAKDKMKELIKEEWEWYKKGKPIDQIAKKKLPLYIWLEDLEPYEDKWDNLGLD